MQTDHDRLIHWLLGSLDLETTLFHVGQYCGTWRASTMGHARAGFHLVLNGNCWLHLPGRSTGIPLKCGDGVFFLRDMPHYLAPCEQAAELDSITAGAKMTPIDFSITRSVALACGFFNFRSPVSQVLMASFPDYVVIAAESETAQGVRSVFDLIQAEAQRDAASPLIARLVGILFFYVIRHQAANEEVAAGIWSALARPEFSRLTQALIDEPGREWTVEAMAHLSNMSRATFFKRFLRISGSSPAHFLTVLRMKAASQLLAQGQSIARTAEQVGYQSEAAFSRAFKKVIGELPGAYKKTRDYQA